MDDDTRQMVEEAYRETVEEAIGRDLGKMDAHKEAVIAAAMLLSAMTGIEDEAAKTEVVDLGLRP